MYRSKYHVSLFLYRIFRNRIGYPTFSFTNEKYARIDNWLISLNPFDRNEREGCKEPEQIALTRLTGGGHASVNEIRRDVTSRNVHTERAFCPQNFEPLPISSSGISASELVEEPSGGKRVSLNFNRNNSLVSTQRIGLGRIDHRLTLSPTNFEFDSQRIVRCLVATLVRIRRWNTKLK